MSLEDKFDENYEEWMEHCHETRVSSITLDYLDCDAYRNIVAMGEQAMPLILEKAKSDPHSHLVDHIVPLLKEIVGDDYKIPEELYEKTKEIRTHALEWLEKEVEFTKYQEHVFYVKCGGRNAEGRSVLKQPICVKIKISRRVRSSMISSDANDCPYNCGGHGGRCKASHPDKEKVGNGITCPYSFDAPYCFEKV